MGGRTIPYDVYGYDIYGDYFDYQPDYYDEYFDIPDLSHVRYMQGPHVTVAEVSYAGLTASEDAKRNKGERTNHNVGRDLAVGRAFVALGQQLIERAYAALED